MGDLKMSLCAEGICYIYAQACVGSVIGEQFLIYGIIIQLEGAKMSFKTLAIVSVLMMGLSACTHSHSKHEGCSCGAKVEAKKCEGKDGKACAMDEKCGSCKDEKAKAKTP